MIGIDGNGISRCRDTGKDVNPIDSKDTQYVEGYRGDANGLVDQIDGTDQAGKIPEGHIIRGDVLRADGLYDLGLGIGERRAVVDIGFKASSFHRHGSENSDRPGPENDGIETLSGGFAVGMMPHPWETALCIPGLSEALFRDGEGFHQDREVPEFGGYMGEEPFPFHE